MSPQQDGPQIYDGNDTTEHCFTVKIGNCCKYIDTVAYLWIQTGPQSGNGHNISVCADTHENHFDERQWSYTLVKWKDAHGNTQYGCHKTYEGPIK